MDDKTSSVKHGSQCRVFRSRTRPAWLIRLPVCLTALNGFKHKSSFEPPPLVTKTHRQRRRLVSLNFPSLVFLQRCNLPFPCEEGRFLHAHPQVPAFLVVPVKDNLLAGKLARKGEGGAVPEINLGDDPPLEPLAKTSSLTAFLIFGISTVVLIAPPFRGVH